MKNKIKYSDEPIEARVIGDFLPSPENLILREKKTRVTLTLTEKSLDFFKGAAKNSNFVIPAKARIQSASGVTT